MVPAFAEVVSTADEESARKEKVAHALAWRRLGNE